MITDMQSEKPIEILLIEDNPGDVYLTRQALVASRTAYHMYVARDRREAMAFLRKQGKYAAAPRPDLILLDLSLPKKDGREVLAEVRADDDLKQIPVVILSGAMEDVDQTLRSFGLHAKSFVRKPGSLREFLSMVHFIQDYWIDMLIQPKAPGTVPI